MARGANCSQVLALFSISQRNFIYIAAVTIKIVSRCLSGDLRARGKKILWLLTGRNLELDQTWGLFVVNNAILYNFRLFISINKRKSQNATGGQLRASSSGGEANVTVSISLDVTAHGCVG